MPRKEKTEQELFEAIHALIDVGTPTPFKNRVRLAIGLPAIKLVEWAPGKFQQEHVRDESLPAGTELFFGLDGAGI